MLSQHGFVHKGRALYYNKDWSDGTILFIHVSDAIKVTSVIVWAI